MATITVGGHLGIETALQGARAPHRLRFGPGAKEAVEASARQIRQAVSEGAWIYGVTTGFGSNAFDSAARPRHCDGSFRPSVSCCRTASS